MGVPGAKSFPCWRSRVRRAISDAAIAGWVRLILILRVFSSDFPTRLRNHRYLTDSLPGKRLRFFVMWLGNNDILSYATGGGTGVDRNALDGIRDVPTYGALGEDITDPEFFTLGGDAWCYRSSELCDCMQGLWLLER